MIKRDYVRISTSFWLENVRNFSDVLSNFSELERFYKNQQESYQNIKKTRANFIQFLKRILPVMEQAFANQYSEKNLLNFDQLSEIKASVNNLQFSRDNNYRLNSFNILMNNIDRIITFLSIMKSNFNEIDFTKIDSTLVKHEISALQYELYY